MFLFSYFQVILGVARVEIHPLFLVARVEIHPLFLVARSRWSFGLSQLGMASGNLYHYTLCHLSIGCQFHLLMLIASRWYFLCFRLMPTADHYNMNIPNNYGPPPSAHYQSYFIPQGASQNAMSNAAHHPSHPYYMRRDGSYAEYPMTRTLPVSPAVRACLHDQSYRSMPQDDIQYQSRQPGHPSVTSAQEVTPSMSATSSSLMSSQEQTSSSLDPLSLDPLSLDVSTSTSASSCDVTAAPLPLNEHQTTATTGSFHSTDLSTQSDEGQRELAAAHRQRNQHPYDAPIQTTDPRYNTYFHLKNLFPEKIVRRVMNKHPTETDPNKITATVLQMQMKAKVVC